MKRSGSSASTSILVLVTPAWPGLVSAGFPGLTSWRKNGAPLISRPATPPRFHSSMAPSASLYQAAAAVASGTISITEITGREGAGSRDGTGGRLGFSVTPLSVPDSTSGNLPGRASPQPHSDAQSRQLKHSHAN